jgi:hypothetical protein
MHFTVGKGLRRPQGKRCSWPDERGRVEAAIEFLSALGTDTEEWWSGHLWDGDRRLAAGWQGCDVIAVDVDWLDASSPTPEAISALTARRIPGSAWHLTPHGCRVIFVLDAHCTDRGLARAASLAAGRLVASAIAGTGYKVDEPVQGDLGRLFYAPRAHAKGVQRDAAVARLRDEPYTLGELAAPPLASGSTHPLSAPAERPDTDLDAAVARWNGDHRRTFPAPGSAQCPVCCHNERGCHCFGRLADDENRWHCFNTEHPPSVGVRAANGFHGDALDLEAHRRGATRVRVLRDDGYLAAPRALPGGGEPAVHGAGAPATRPLRSRSYLTAVTIISDNLRGVLGPGRLELNEMTGLPELGRRPLTDADESRIRSEIERRFVGGKDKQGNELGLSLSVGDVHDACAQVAAANPYHPVREYLGSLTWDRVERIAYLPDLLGAVRSELNQTLLRAWMIAAVARVMRPGCQVDNVLVLQGEQGVYKSSFFRAMGGEWFRDTPISLSKVPDCYQILRSAWIYEWAELETLKRASRSTEVKSFLTSTSDTYRPSYGRNAVTVHRSVVIVGTTNEAEFLADETGARRFWPVPVTTVDIAGVREQRDQLWAEAVVAFREGARWWLDVGDTASESLRAVHEEYAVRDAWEPLVLSWAQGRSDMSVADILAHALAKPPGQWTRGDEMRVAAILRSNGFTRRKTMGTIRWSSP